jgi:hypothetical protein
MRFSIDEPNFHAKFNSEIHDYLKVHVRSFAVLRSSKDASNFRAKSPLLVMSLAGRQQENCLFHAVSDTE